MDDAGVLPGFTGVAVHYGFSPYRAYTDAAHALCGAHHLRELIAATEAEQLWASGMSCFLLDTKYLVYQSKTAIRQALYAPALSELHYSYRYLIASATSRTPASHKTTAG